MQKFMYSSSLFEYFECQVTVLDPVSWPSAKDLKLDDSQFNALQLALTKEFAVIQGPPGTGKTYIGLKVYELLLLVKGTEKYIDIGWFFASSR